MSGPEPKSDAPLLIPAYRSPSAVVIVVITLIVLLVGDLALKQWAFTHIEPGVAPTVVVPSVLSLTRVENEGAVFGIGQGKQALFIMFTFVAIAVIAGMFAFSRSTERWFHLALAAIAAGALGNLYDRMAFNFVRDMLYLFPGVELPSTWTWPNGSRELYPWVFNLADTYLVVAISFLLIRSFFVKDPKPTTDKPAPPNGG